VIILGHNQFFGINHGSARVGLDKSRIFKDPNYVESFLESAIDLGIEDLMLSTHENSVLICEKIRSNKRLSSTLRIHVLLPYMAKFVRKANESGPINMVLEIVKDNGLYNNFNLAGNLISTLFSKDLKYLLESLISIELNTFKGLNIETVFLHNSLSDLIASIKLHGAYNIFYDYIKKSIKANPGICTLNTSVQLKWLEDMGIESPLLMAPFNKIGHQMSPNRVANEEAIKNSKANIIAMSIFASGYVSPKEAFSYINDLGIKSVIIGTSNIEHLEKNIKIYKSLF
jgi:hypothetical protein